MEPPVSLSSQLEPAFLVAAFSARFPAPLGELVTPPALAALLGPHAAAPLAPHERVRAAVRDVLRRHGYRPAGRGKPSSEFLAAAAAEGRLGAINVAVDVTNAVSRHSGLPLSVVDLDRLAAPLHLALAGPDDRYVFNASGQVIALAGLPCLHDATGPCANAIKDSQRSKTSAATTRTLTLFWSASDLRALTEAALAWHVELLQDVGARCTPVAVETTAG